MKIAGVGELFLREAAPLAQLPYTPTKVPADDLAHAAENSSMLIFVNRGAD
jgi:hypothetical protein